MRERQTFPTSLVQRASWKVWRRNRKQPSPSVSSAFRIQGNLRLAPLEECLQALVRRHPALRVHFELEGQQLVQVAEPRSEPVLRTVKLARGTSPDRLLSRLRDEVAKPFDLAKGPLFRVKLFRLGEQEHMLLFMAHHSVSDAQSFAILYRELELLYSQKTGMSPEAGLAPPSGTYGQYEAWYQQQLSNASFLETLNHWRQHLGGHGLPPHLERAPLRPKPSGAFQREAWMDRTLVERLKQVCEEEACTPFMVLMAGYYAYLWKAYDENDFIVEFMVSTRRHTSQATFGRLINTMAIRMKVSAGTSFKSLLTRTRELCWKAYRDRDVPLSFRLPPVFNHLFQINAFPEVSFRLPGLEVSEYNVPLQRVSTLLLEFRLGDPEIQVLMKYPRRLARVAQPERYVHMLAHLLKDTSQRLSTVDSQKGAPGDP